MLRKINAVVFFLVAICTLSRATFGEDGMTEKQVLKLHKYWPKEDISELGSSSTSGDSGENEAVKMGFWAVDGKRNGFWNGKRNGFWNGKRNFDDLRIFGTNKKHSSINNQKRNGFWNGKRNFDDFEIPEKKEQPHWRDEKKNGFWNGKRNFDNFKTDDLQQQYPSIEDKRNGFWNGKRNFEMSMNKKASASTESEKRNGFYNGKRSVDNTMNISSYHYKESAKKCTTCGPGGKGQCVMYGVCCSLEIGCSMLTKETEECTTSPLVGECGRSDVQCGNGGRCVANGVCCTKETQSCKIDQECNVRW